MSIEVKIIEDSINLNKFRLTTMQLRYPRFIHAEFMTHRVFSRNASSSRAIPVEKLIQSVLDDPVYPTSWGVNKPGMQASESLSGASEKQARLVWEMGMEEAVKTARRLVELNVHKQLANRILEPYSHINVVVSATDWDNFFELRCHKDAQPEIQELATAMREARDNSAPKEVFYGEWHLPYITEDERSVYQLEDLKKMSCARLARVSYNKHDGTKPSPEEDLKLFDRLAGSVPIHASPLEHVATPGFGTGNYVGWDQYRHIWEQEVYGVHS